MTISRKNQSKILGGLETEGPSPTQDAVVRTVATAAVGAVVATVVARIMNTGLDKVGMVQHKSSAIDVSINEDLAIKLGKQAERNRQKRNQ